MNSRIRVRPVFNLGQEIPDLFPGGSWNPANWGGRIAVAEEKLRRSEYDKAAVEIKKRLEPQIGPMLEEKAKPLAERTERNILIMTVLGLVATYFIVKKR
jgi:hypothetical protein